ncbi:DUF1552 domain-containing protein [Sandaracinus amylolyticus]|nr:DUF1552 domain-containing protein [Sandaracinus amylolyticus]
MISRRMFLRGAGGAALAIPFLPSLLEGGTAHAQDRGRTSFVAFLSQHGGVSAANMYPADATLTDVAMAAEGHHEVRRGALSLSTSGGIASLSPVLSASSSVLTPAIASKMNVLRGLDITYDIAHHYCGASLGNLAINSSSDDPYDRGPRRSIDQVMAWSSAVYPDPRAVQLRSFTVAQNQAVSWGYQNPAAGSGPIQAVGDSWTSATLFDRLFPTPTTPPSSPRRRLVDLVYERYRRLRDGHRRLSSADRERLEAHMARIAELERRLGAAPISCTSSPERPEDNGPLLRGAYDGRPDQHVRYFQLYNEVLAAALACGATRIAVLCGDAYVNTFSSHPSASWHDEIAHRVVAMQDVMVGAQRRFFADVVLDLASRLESVVEDDGATALDRSLIVWMQEHSNVTHDNFSIPAVTLGSADGFFSTGNYCDYRNRARLFSPWEDTTERSAPGLTYQQFWANCLQAMGVPHDEWAEPDHPGYSARFTHVINADFPVRPASDWSDAVWRTAGDVLPFLAR